MPQTTVLVGTTKGAFVLSNDGGRGGWTVAGPYCGGSPVNHVIGDADSGTIWAAGGGDWHGAAVWTSADHGTTWTMARFANGKIDYWIVSEPEFAAQIGLKPSPATVAAPGPTSRLACHPPSDFPSRPIPAIPTGSGRFR